MIFAKVFSIDLICSLFYRIHSGHIRLSIKIYEIRNVIDTV